MNLRPLDRPWPHTRSHEAMVSGISAGPGTRRYPLSTRVATGMAGAARASAESLLPVTGSPCPPPRPTGTEQ